MRHLRLALCSLSLAACGGGSDGTDPGPVPASVSISVSQAAPMASIGESRTLTATVRDAAQAEIPGAAVTWSTDNQAVATLSGSSGKTTTATAAGNGTATIRAQSGTVSQTAALTVAQVLSAVKVSPTTFNVNVGATQQLTATARDANDNAISGVTGFGYSSSNDATATVSGSGLVTGVANGDATITISLTRDGVTRNTTATAHVGASPYPTSAPVQATPSLTFEPPSVDIAANGSVSWNFGSVEHNVIFDNPGSPSNIAGSNKNTSISRTFPDAGTFPYHCGIHPTMTGTVVVH